ncbi:LAGLIDADG family homing endonuclease [Thermococcus sp.]
MRKLRELAPWEIERIQSRARELRSHNISYSKIKESIADEFNVSVSKATVLRWCNGTHNTFNKTKRVNLEPSPELAYIVGAYLGDASVSERNYQYRIRLKVIDRDFAQSFERALRTMGANPRTGFERNRGRANRWWVEVTNKELFMFLKGPKERLFEVAGAYPKEFLRGFFDSEGSAIVYPNRARVEASNYDLEILELCKELLERLGIHSKIYKTKRKGQTVVIRGKEYRYNSDLFTLRIYQQDSVYRYTVEVGFSIQRKQILLLQHFKLLKHDDTKSFENTTKSTP